MKKTLTIMTLFSLSFLGTSLASDIGQRAKPSVKQKNKLISNFGKRYRELIDLKTKYANKISPRQLSRKFKREEDRKYFVELSKSVNLQFFPKVKLVDGVYIARLPLGHTMKFSAVDVAQGSFYIDKYKFQTNKNESFKVMSIRLKAFLRKNIVKTSSVNFINLFVSPAYAVFSAEISDIIVANTAGLISINYDEADLIHTENDYAKILKDSLVKEIKAAQAECTSLKEELKESRYNGLSKNVGSILESMIIEKDKKREIQDYFIISAIMKKHAGTIKEEKVGSVKKGSNLIMKAANDIDVQKRYAGSILDNRSACNRMVTTMLPNAVMSDTRATYDGYKKDICKNLGTLKSCFADIDKVNQKRVNSSYSDPIEGREAEVLEKLDWADDQAQ